MKLFALLLLHCCALAAVPGSPRLEWDAVTPYYWVEVDQTITATNYIVYLGGESRAYTNDYAVGTNTFWNLPKMAPGKTNFMAVTATYDFVSDTLTNESDYSEEVWYVPRWLATPLIVLSGNTVTWSTTGESNVTNYTFAIYATTQGTNLVRNWGTNRTATVPNMTNGVWSIQVRAENHHIESRWGIRRVINVPLNVPAGKFYVEKGNTVSNWLAVSTVTGPVTVWFPVSQTMEFFRFRPFFMAAANPKSGKLTKATAAMFKSKPVPVTNAPPQRILGPINLMPPKQ